MAVRIDQWWESERTMFSPRVARFFPFFLLLLLLFLRLTFARLMAISLRFRSRKASNVVCCVDTSVRDCFSKSRANVVFGVFLTLVGLFIEWNLDK